MNGSPALRLRRNVVAALAAASAVACGGGGEFTGLEPDEEVEFRTAADAPWRTGSVGLLRDTCITVFEPSPPPPDPPRRFTAVPFDDIESIRIRRPPPSRADTTAPRPWTEVSGTELRRHHQPCPLY